MRSAIGASPPATNLAEFVDSNMATRVLAVVCAWCKRVVTPEANATGITHTICPSCLDRTMTHIDEGSVDPATFQPSDYFGDVFKR
jgi:hypothetical protein